MNTTQRGIVILLKSAVTGEALPLPEGFDIEDAYPVIKAHHMASLAYEGAANCGIPMGETMQLLFQRYCKAMQISERQLRQVRRIYAAFDENGIDYMPLKGCNMKPRYPKPELRMMGDADILIRMEQYDRIRPVMESLGFTEKNETDHELHWEHPALHVELHKRVIPSYNKDFMAYFGDGWQLSAGREGGRHYMTPEDEWIYIFTHFAKHCRDGGIGCRHVLDLWVYLRTFPELDGGYVAAELEKLQLLEFHENIRALLSAWFGGGEVDEKTEFLTQFVFSSGSWGAAESRVLSRMVRDTGRTGASGRLVYLWKTAFPGVAILRDKYTVLQKAPWLLPAVWIYRPFYKFLREFGTLDRKKADLDALTPESMTTRREMLEYVGLEYHF